MSIFKTENSLLRVLASDNNRMLVIDCIKRTMPRWIVYLEDCEEVPEEGLQAILGVKFEDIEELSPKTKKTMYERYTLISGVLSFVKNDEMRNKAIESISKEHNVSKQTVRRYLCQYLAFNDIRALAPMEKDREVCLSSDEKNIRYALNKFFYNKNKNTLKYAYIMMLKEKYCDGSGKLLDKYPSFYQFRYFYRKTKNLQTFYISRNGLKDYQKNFRPLLGDGIQEFAPCIGTAMLDSTICDIYLVNEENQIVGRPVLTACVDAYSGLCCGYSLTWQGGIYSLRNLMLNVISDKKEHCKKFGIDIDSSDWNAHQMPLKLVTDKGSEYKGENFEQLIDLGINIVNLPSYRPELKGAVEKFFDVIQDYYKPTFKGKGVIEPDFQERGAHDYRKDACLTLEQFEEVILRCIIFYNTQRIVKNFPYTEDMLLQEIKPHANCIWNYKLKKTELMNVSKKDLILTLLPRTEGKFTRQGLKVNGLRYRNENFKEEYLDGKEVMVAYNPDSVDSVFYMENGKYIEFSLIESRFKEKSLEDISDLKYRQGELERKETERLLQGEIDLSKHMQLIRDSVSRSTKADIKGIRSTRKREEAKTRRNLVKSS